MRLLALLPPLTHLFVQGRSRTMSLHVLYGVPSRKPAWYA